MAFPNQPHDGASIPIGSPYVPNVSFAALEGSVNTNTDASGNLTTAAMMALDQSLVISGQLQNAQNGNANGSTLTMNGMGCVLFEVIQTGFTGTVNFEGAGVNANYDPLWVNQQGTNTIANTVVGSTTTATHLYTCSDTSGLQTVRARTSSVSAGTVTVNAYALPVPVGPRSVNANIAQFGGVATQMGGSDGVANTNVPLIGHANYNNSTWDRQYNNLDNITLLASAARTTTQTVADQTNFNHRGVVVVLDMTVIGTGNVTLEIDGKDPVSGKYYAILTGAAVSSNTTNAYTVYPGNTATANVSASTVLPRTWRVKVTANNANSTTYSVGCMLVV